ncbi:hypothetical protein CJ255_09250 [Candidatus Viridilinea mediisalina]|uniref:RloB domain-containing protein n=1 Tax=Candidatus Viridilinea mediisalina TaxID=2024553 RepID=A0A2A6RKB6_9CHLR|nr:hypothetical protein CJ255_09250 [Candidatus Viridilinea mediisalina]
MSQKRFARQSKPRTRRKVFVIATEGEATEKIYFDVFNSDKFRREIIIIRLVYLALYHCQQKHVNMNLSVCLVNMIRVIIISRK